MQRETVLSLRAKTSEEILKQFDLYIVARVQRLRHSYPAIAPSDIEIDELVQSVRIKFWQAIQKRDIMYPAAYIKLIVKNEFIDRLRRQKSLILLPIDEENLNSEDALSINHYAPDPADEVEQSEEVSTRLKEAIQAVLALPPRQRFAMICALRERVDNLTQLVDAFKVYKVDIEAIRWPTNKTEKQLLQSSLAPARKAVAKYMQSKSA